jgi:hypothetical protein
MTVTKVFFASSLLALLVGVVPTAQEKMYVSQPKEELYGTWINRNVFPEKTVINPNGTFADYNGASAITPFRGGHLKIFNKWTDREGNVYYQGVIKVTFPIIVSKTLPEKMIDENLFKVSNSGEVLEINYQEVKEGDFDPKYFPKTIDPKDNRYLIFYRPMNVLERAKLWLRIFAGLIGFRPASPTRGTQAEDSRDVDVQTKDLIKYVPKANEEIYGTWTNENAPQLQKKTVISPGRFKDYLSVSDTSPFQEGRLQIAEKWTDSEDTVWYKVLVTVDVSGYKVQVLHKISKSGTIHEWTALPVREFDPLTYPTQIVPGTYYGIQYRVKE